MKIEDQVCSFDLAKRLKELGVKQGSLFNYIWQEDIRQYQLHFMPSEQHISAFTVAELIEMMPGAIELSRYKSYPSKKPRKLKKKDIYCLNFSRTTYGKYGLKEWNVGYGYKLYASKILADSYAKCLIFLLEEGIVKP